MDFNFLGMQGVNSWWGLLAAIASIVIVDIVLAGDNAVVIAMAVKKLPPKERLIGITLGAGAAVVLRVILTFFAAQLMQLSFVKLVGGALILWIAVKLLLQGIEDSSGEGSKKEAYSIWQAIWLIMIADVTMSTDNVLAVAGASKGSLALLLFGLGLSIPLVVFTSSLLSKLMDRYPIILYIGAAVLGRVGGEMMISDLYVTSYYKAPHWLDIFVQVFFAVGVLAVGYLIKRIKKGRMSN